MALSAKAFDHGMEMCGSPLFPLCAFDRSCLEVLLILHSTVLARNYTCLMRKRVQREGEHKEYPKPLRIGRSDAKIKPWECG